MAHAGHARNFEWTLRILAERGHAVHVALDRDMDADVAGRGGLLPSLAAEYPRLTLGPAPARRRRGAELLAEVLRASLDYLRYLEPEFADAAKLRSRAGGWLPERLRAVADRALVRSPRARRAARRA